MGLLWRSTHHQTLDIQLSVGLLILKSQQELTNVGIRLSDHLLEASMPPFQVLDGALLVPDDATVNVPFGWIIKRCLPAKGLAKGSFGCRLSNVCGYER